MALLGAATIRIRPDPGFLRTVESWSRQPVAACYRCLKCTAGCPMAQAMDYPPDQLMRMVQLGLGNEALGSRAIWLCTGCLACSERCPNGIDVAGVLDVLKQIALRERIPAGERRIATFHQTFLATVQRYGRMHEATLIALLKAKTGDLFSDLGVGLKLLVKGKLPPLPARIRGRREVASAFEMGHAPSAREEDG